MVAKTLFGFEELLAKELTQLGALNVEIGVRNVSFVGDKGFMYKANLGLRTAIKILKPIRTFRVVTEQDIYDNIYKMQWENYLIRTSDSGTPAPKYNITNYMCQVSATPPAKKTAGLIENETDERRTSNIERPTSNIEY